jgi:hypothetical protein
MSADLDRVRRAQDRLLAEVENDPDVNGVGIGRDGDRYVLMVNLRVTAAAVSVPDEIDGVPVTKRTVGTIRKR